MGYSWVDEHTPQSANQGHGAGLAGRRALLVIIGKPPFPPLPPFPSPLSLAIFNSSSPYATYQRTQNELTQPPFHSFKNVNLFRRFHSRVHHDGLPSAQLCPNPLPPPSRQEHVRYRRSLWESGDEYRERSGCCRMG